MLLRKPAVFSVLLLSFLLIGLSACSRNNKDQSEQQTAVQQPPAQPAPPQVAPATAPTPPEAAPALAPAPSVARVPAKRARTNVKRSSVPGLEADVHRTRPPVQNLPPEASAPDYRTVQPVEAPSRSESVPVIPPTPPRPAFAVIPAGTQLEVRLTDSLSSAENHSGDPFEGTLDQDVQSDGQVIAPRGSMVTGKVVHVERSGRVQGLASMSVTLTGIRLQSETFPINTTSLSFEAESTKKQDAAKVGAGAGIGAVIGAIAGGGKGAAIGAAVGAGAGTGTVLASRGKEVTLKTEDRYTFVLKSDLRVPLQRDR